MNMQIGLSPGMSIGVILAVIAVMLSGLAGATFSVEPGHSIQSAINMANPGQIIEVQNGTFNEKVNVTKPLTLKGVGKPIIDAGGIGSAITISANGSTLLGFTATRSGQGAGDAGIKVLSDGNIIKDNIAIKNNNHGIFLYHVDKNTVFLNSAIENKKSGIMLVHSNNNQIWGNNISTNWNGISIETSRSNAIKANNLTRNEMGINISNQNLSESITAKGKGVSIKYGSSGQLTTFNINKNSSSSPDVNLLYQNDLQDNHQNAFDDGYNQWDNGEAGNHYSDYDGREQGCKDRNRDGICDSSYNIPGGDNMDKLPKASPDAILSYKSKGIMGSELKIDHKTFLPGMDVNVTYVAPRNFSGWVGVMKADLPMGRASKEEALSYQNLAGPSGMVLLSAPIDNGSYDIGMYNFTSGEEIVSLDINVGIPTIIAAPPSLNTCELINVSYAAAPGYENDWIAMFKSGSPEESYITRRYLNGNENGIVTLEASDPGSYDFRMFENDSYTQLATSNSVEVKAYKGRKVIASPSHVAPGGIVTVTYWGAPSSGTGIIGLYGVNRPDKFALEKRGLGSKNCGRMTWRLPGPGRYDFRMFYSDITSVGQGAYQILGQSNVVTVG
jgi:nitrous oxidase accessory protein